jgi:hypothetical protein
MWPRGAALWGFRVLFRLKCNAEDACCCLGLLAPRFPRERRLEDNDADDEDEIALDAE